MSSTNIPAAKTVSATQRDFESLENLSQNPEVKSYINQVTVEFLPFVTPSTIVSVVSKDPTLLQKRLLSRGKKVSKKRLSEMHRIELSLSDEGTTVSAEALDRNIFTAIQKAKERLVAHLIQIQNSVMSEQDRIIQMQNAQLNSNVH